MQTEELTEEMSEELRNKRSEQGFEELCSLIIKSKDKDFLMDFLASLLTPAEKKDIANRWLLVKEIANGKSQRDIAKSFKMSLCKITRGSKELKKQNSPFKKMLELSASEQK